MHIPTSASALPINLQLGLAASAQGDSETALAMFSKEVEANSGAGLPHFLMGSEYASQGHMDLAEGAFTNAVLLAPDLHIARYQLGLLQFSSARAATALLTWQPLLELGNESPLYHFVHGFSALAHDHFGEAIASFEEGILRNTDNPPMTTDIQKVIQGIHAVIAANDAPLPVASKDAPPAEEQEQTHVLFSNYLPQNSVQ